MFTFTPSWGTFYLIHGHQNAVLPADLASNGRDNLRQNAA